MRRVAFVVTILLIISPAVAQDTATLRELRAVIDERDARYNQRFESQEKAVAAALAAAKEAVTKAETASEKRFEGVNEFRNTLRDQQTTLITRVEVDAKLKAINEKVDEIAVRQNQVGSRLEAISWVWGIMVGAGGLLIGAAGFYFNFRKTTR